MLYIDIEYEDGTKTTLEFPPECVYSICKKCSKKQYGVIYSRFLDEKGNDKSDSMLCFDCEEKEWQVQAEKKRLQFCKKHGLPEVWTEDTLKDYLARKKQVK